MKCPACNRAEVIESWEFSGERCCVARGVARITYRMDRTTLDYRKLLEHESVTHDEVRAARNSDAYCKRMMKEPTHAR